MGSRSKIEWTDATFNPWVGCTTTKRPQNIRKMLPSDWGEGYPNVWLGTTAEDASAYKQRAPFLLKVSAAIHFVSYEPAMVLLGD